MGSKVHVVLASVFLVGTTVVFIIIGAAGPKSTLTTLDHMYMCITPHGSDHVWNPKVSLIDEDECHRVGRPMKREEENQDKLKYYPIEKIVFFTQVPIIKDQVMARDFEFLITDISMQFMFNSYVQRFVEKGQNVVKFEVALGYRDDTHGPWTKMVSGNVTRKLNCGFNKDIESLYTCDSLPLFELGSCHHKQYLINAIIPSLPLDDNPEYRGLSQIDRLTIFEIHQSLRFTRLWLAIKTFLFPVTLVGVLWYWKRLFQVKKTRETRTVSLIERFLGVLGASLVFYNAPFQYISLFYDCPWLLVVKDLQQGVFIASLFSFWIIFVSEHSPDKDINAHISYYWKQMGVVSVASIFFFVYEFCERGIQVFLPFYSLWSNDIGILTAWIFIGIASTSSFLYLVILLVTLFRVLRGLRSKQKELQSLSPDTRKNLSGLFDSLRFFLVLTFMVALCSILTVVLPSDVLLHQWQHGSMDYNYYSGILTGNYGMWNAYCLVMFFLYLPSVSKATTPGGQSSAQQLAGEDPTSFEKLITKKSQK